MTFTIKGPNPDQVVIRNSDYQYFAGYDFMGSVNWVNQFSFDITMPLSEARDIVRDLRAAED